MRGVCKLYASLFQPFNMYIILGLGSEECGIVWEEKKGRVGVRVRFVDCGQHREKGGLCVWWCGLE